MTPADAGRMAPDERQEQILRIAAAHFAREGYDASSVSRIAAEAGVTRALVYHYFPGKASLLEAVLQRRADALLKATAPDPHLSAEANLQRALSATLDHFSGCDQGLCELSAQSHGVVSPVAERISRASHAVQVERILALTGLEPSPRAELAVQAWLGFVVEAARGARSGDLSREEVVELCVGALRGAVSSLTPSGPR